MIGIIITMVEMMPLAASASLLCVFAVIFVIMTRHASVSCVAAVYCVASPETRVTTPITGDLMYFHHTDSNQ